jgi:hypothetical protein
VAIDVDSLQTFTKAQLLKLTEYCIAQILAGCQEYDYNGRRVTRADLATLYRERDRLAAEVAAEAGADTAGGNVLVTINRG